MFLATVAVVLEGVKYIDVLKDLDIASASERTRDLIVPTTLLHGAVRHFNMGRVPYLWIRHLLDGSAGRPTTTRDDAGHGDDGASAGASASASVSVSADGGEIHVVVPFERGTLDKEALVALGEGEGDGEADGESDVDAILDILSD